jgi:hypothetical protein
MDIKRPMDVEARLKAGKPNQFFPSRGSPVPLWQKARTRANGFRREDLERTHWKKVCRAMFAD